MAYEYGKVKIQVRHDTAANFASVNPVLASGEPAFSVDNNTLKIGDGSTAYSSLSGIAGGGGGGGGGDITAVTAGTGLNGGGTTGAVTVNIDDTVLTTGNLTARTGLILTGKTLDIDTTVFTTGNLTARTGLTLTGKTLDIDTTVLTTGNLNAKLQSASGIMLTYVPASTSLEIATSGQILAHMSGAPANATAAGSLGEIRFDTTHLYIAIGTNVWKRVAISTF